MVQLCEHDACVGCGACANACPRNCIRMSANADGFFYPVVKTDDCIDCGLCRKACPVLAPEQCDRETDAYAAYCENEQVQGASSSGGVFTLLAERILRNNGVVYGAGFDEYFRVKHLRIDHLDQLQALRGSKYAQSDMGSVYAQVKQDLKNGRHVLFSGTPCQVAGLHSFLGAEDEHLISIDIICHSVPSSKVLRRYLQSVEEAEKSQVVHVNFRDKRESWQGYYLRVAMKNGHELLCRGGENRYMRAMIQGLSTRTSCYGCKFKGENRKSDITLGDFWGVESACPEMFHKDGTSLVLTHTLRGRRLFEEVSGSLRYQKADIKKALQDNPAYSMVSRPHRYREEFFKKLEDEDFIALVDRLLAPTQEELRQQKRNNSILMRVLRKLRQIFQ